MTETTRWKVLRIAAYTKAVPLEAAIEWLSEDIEYESDDPDVAYNQMVADLHPERD